MHPANKSIEVYAQRLSFIGEYRYKKVKLPNPNWFARLWKPFVEEDQFYTVAEYLDALGLTDRVDYGWMFNLTLPEGYRTEYDYGDYVVYDPNGTKLFSTYTENHIWHGISGMTHVHYWPENL